MSELALIRALHVLGVVLWIGGVAFVTLALLPGLRDLHAEHDGVAPETVFAAMERRFARQARWTTQLTGLTGLFMLWRLNLWSRFADPAYWWMHAMVAVWALFTLMLFVIEPLVLRRRSEHPDPKDAPAELRRMLLIHRVLLALSLVTVLGAVAGSHGWVFDGVRAQGERVAARHLSVASRDCAVSPPAPHRRAAAQTPQTNRGCPDWPWPRG